MRVVNILLVDNDTADALDIKLSLAKLNIIYKLIVVKTGMEGIDVLTKSRDDANEFIADLVLIDCELPDMTGIELLSIIRTSPEGRNLKCFMLCASVSAEDKQTAKHLLVSGWIPKPLKLNAPMSAGAFNLMIDLINLKEDNSPQLR